MINNPKFSIVTITFNAAKDLEPTIKSIIEQDYDNIEYLIIDGGSKDDTLKIAEKYSTNIDYIVSGKDNGLYDAMNKGLRAATGDYIWFINAGDALHSPFVVREIVSLLKDKNELPTVIYGETAIIDENRRFIGMRRLKAPEKLTWRSFMMGMLVCHQSFIVRKDIAGEYDLTYRFSSDFDWCIRAMKQKGEILNSKIGRASCRERVLRLVLLSVVAEIIKKYK